MRRAAPWGAILVVITLLAACRPPTPAAPPPPAQGAAAAPTEAAAPPPGPLTTVTVGQVTAVLYPFYLGIERGYFMEQGIEIQYETFRNGSETVPLIANGQLDVSQQSVSISTFNAVLRGLPIKAIFDASHTAPDQRSHALLVGRELSDSGAVRSPVDLVGRKVAESSIPGGLGIDVDKGLRAVGHRVEEFDQVVLPFPDMPAALANGSVDAAIAVEPSITTALKQESAVVLRWLSEDYPGHQIAVQVIGPNLLGKPDLTRRLAVAYLRGARDWDAAARGIGVDELARLLSTYNRLDPAVNADLLRRKGLTSIDPDGQISKESLAYDMAWYVEGGHLERPIDLDQFVDMQYADFAVGQLAAGGARR
jgi:NitT/TauT family transport system substrate-binding protein